MPARSTNSDLTVDQQSHDTATHPKFYPILSLLLETRQNLIKT